MIGWALLADVVPLYPLYALLFAHAGLSDAKISLLFTIWSAVGMLAEIPTGMLADRFSHRGALVVGAVAQGLAYLVWTLQPDFAGFAVGFVLWGIGGSFVSGASEALLYEGLTARGAQRHFPAVFGRMRAVGLLAQAPAALAATILYPLGGYGLVGWGSVGTQAAAAVLARLIPMTPPSSTVPDAESAGTLRKALRELRTSPLVRAGVLAVAALAGLDAFEEYDNLLAGRWGVPVSLIPILGLGLPLAGALGAAMGGRWSSRRRPPTGLVLGGALGGGSLLLGAAAVAARPSGLLAVFAFYGTYCAVQVAAGGRLQQQIEGSARATITSVASLLSELAAFGVYAAFAGGGALAVAGLVLLVAAALPRWLRT